MPKNRIILLSLMLLLIILIISSIGIKNYLKKETDLINLYNDYDRATIVYSLAYNKYKEDYFSSIRFQQKYFKGKKMSKMDLIYDLKKYDIIKSLNFLQESNENTLFEESLDNFVEYLMYINYYLNPNGAEAGFTRNDTGNYYYVDDNKYIYNYTKKVIKIETLKKLYEKFLEEQSINANTLLEDLMWKNSIVKSYYGNDKNGYKIMTKEIENNYNDFYTRFESIINGAIKDNFDGFIQFLFDGITINKDTSDITSINYGIDMESNLISINYEIVEIQDSYNDLTKYSNKIYGLNIENLKSQLSKYGYPLIFS